ncbi:MAG TPA: CHAD domain-containing protein [Gemmatimonadales bacterium]|nr:CHAD domain-containing protein [Gemmatimonadales bacterium]
MTTTSWYGSLGEEGARRLALRHLESAVAARARLAAGSDPEALHDYRVALRRLRSCLRAYRRQLRSTVSRKSVRQLRRLTRGTGESRDLDVHLEWLGEQLAGAGRTEQFGIASLMDRLAATRSRVWDAMMQEDAALFPPVHRRLSRQLSRFRTTVRLDADPREASTAVVTAGRIRAAAEQLKDRLHWILRGYSSETEIHRARIAAKHLRYLLEPFAAGVPGGGAVTERLKALQSDFGDVHDSHLFVAEIRSALREARRAASGGGDVVPGLLQLIAALRARGLQAFERSASVWLGDRADGFFREVDAVADAVAALAQPPAPDEKTLASS